MKNLFQRILLLAIALLNSFIVFGQVNVSGKVLNQTDAKPVANASVFISNATVGDKTGADGGFTLKNIKPGTYELVVSSVGFEVERKSIVISGSDADMGNIMILPKTNSLTQVNVTAKRSDPDRQRYLEWFRDEFLGTSPLAKECKILNPELLDLSYDERNTTLTASSVDFLTIENNALGYRIKYLLSNFTLFNQESRDRSFSYSGSVLFETMQGTSSELERWKTARRQVYEGSQMHFLRALAASRLEQEGFRVYRIPANPDRPADSLINQKISTFKLLKGDDKRFKDSLNFWLKKQKLPLLTNRLDATALTKDEIVELHKNNVYGLTCDMDALYVIYSKNKLFSNVGIHYLSDPVNTTNTLATFNTPVAYFDSNGSLLNPTSLTYDGTWIRNRVSGLLPVDYEPQPVTTGITKTDAELLQVLKLNAYNTTHPVEKVYLHFDKPYYTLRDTIYFKAYATIGQSHQPDTLSGVLIAELLKPNNRIVKSIKINLSNGTGRGDFALPDSLPAGNYRIRAYTNYMLNNQDYVFDKLIAVGGETAAAKTFAKEIATNKKTVTAQPAIATKQKYKVQFFPEGGELVNASYCRVAFKATGTDGYGVKLTGTITDENDKQLAAITATHLGMGAFDIAPEAGKRYIARLTWPDGTTSIEYLPEASNKGYSMYFINSDTATIVIRISAAGGLKTSGLMVIAQQNQKVCYTSRNDKPEGGFFTVRVAKNMFRSGVVQFTLFSVNNEPLAERLVFIKHHDNLQITVTANKNAAPRQKTNLAFVVKNAGGQPVTGDFSVAVTDEGQVKTDENDETTLLSSLLLTSDLKGFIEQPNYYFADSSRKAAEDLDILMLTQGYRRFTWKNVLGDQVAPGYGEHKPEIALSIKGRVTKGKEPVANGSVTLFSKGKLNLLLNTTTDAGGRFRFDSIAFNDTARFVIQAHTAAGKREVTIAIDEPDTFKYDIEQTAADTHGLSVNVDNYVKTSNAYFGAKEKFGFNTVNQLKTVNIKYTVKKKLEHSQNLNGPGNADQVFDAADLGLNGYGNLYDALRSRVRFVKFDNGYVFSNRTSQDLTTGKQMGPMLVVLDGDIIDDRSLSAINVEQVESVEIGLGTVYGAAYGSRGANGVIIVTTKPGRKGIYNNYAAGLITYTAHGFYKARDFYMPDYDNPKTNKAIPDLRSTIYWKPSVVTDEKGNATIEYFNADTKGTYRVVVEGIDANGNLGRQVYRYTVN